MSSRRLNPQQILDYLAELETDDNDVDEIIIEPPSADYASGEDDADEDSGGNILDIHHNQIQGCVFVVRENGADLDGEVIYDSEKNENNMEHLENLVGLEIELPVVQATDTLSVNTSLVGRKRKYCEISQVHSQNLDVPPNLITAKNCLKWKYVTDLSPAPFFPETSYEDCNKTPIELFYQFFDDDIISMIVSESNSYAQLKNQTDVQITDNDIRTYIGILINSGYVQPAECRLMWKADDDVHNKAVSNAMSLNRFKSIGQYLHFASNDQYNPNDKMWKLRPLTDRLNKNFVKCFHPEQNLSYDESMIAYYGRHGCKQFIKGKPLRFGYKVWCLNTPLGYCISFDVYQGKNHRYNPRMEEKFGKCVTPMLYMIHFLPEHVKILPFCFYFDNLFTGIPLLHYLKYHGYNGTGTVRENRIPKSCPLQNKKDMQKEKRGFSISRQIEGTDIVFTKWVDNSIVTMASTLYGEEPKDVTQRYSREAKQRVNISRPAVVSAYNRNMGGVDRMDQNVANYRISVRKKKWWWSIFTWTLDVAIQNAWLLHRKSKNSMSQLQFRRNLAQHLLKTCSDQARSEYTTRRYAHIANASTRYDGVAHYVQPCNRRHCALEGCKGQSRAECKKCNVGLCIKCFELYHTKRIRQ